MASESSSPEDVSRRLEAVRETCSELRPSRPPVDMSPAAVSHRLRELQQMTRLRRWLGAVGHAATDGTSLR